MKTKLKELLSQYESRLSEEHEAHYLRQPYFNGRHNGRVEILGDVIENLKWVLHGFTPKQNWMLLKELLTNDAEALEKMMRESSDNDTFELRIHLAVLKNGLDDMGKLEKKGLSDQAMWDEYKEQVKSDIGKVNNMVTLSGHFLHRVHKDFLSSILLDIEMFEKGREVQHEPFPHNVVQHVFIKK